MSEMFIKMYGLGTRPYFHSSFNCFDCGVSALVSKEFIPRLIGLEWLIPRGTGEREVGSSLGMTDPAACKRNQRIIPNFDEDTEFPEPPPPSHCQWEGKFTDPFWKVRDDLANPLLGIHSRET